MDGLPCSMYRAGGERSLIHPFVCGFGNWPRNRLSVNLAPCWFGSKSMAGQVYEMPTIRPCGRRCPFRVIPWPAGGFSCLTPISEIPLEEERCQRDLTPQIKRFMDRRECHFYGPFKIKLSFPCVRRNLRNAEARYGRGRNPC
jgi:hypothetical protein